MVLQKKVSFFVKETREDIYIFFHYEIKSQKKQRKREISLGSKLRAGKERKVSSRISEWGPTTTITITTTTRFDVCQGGRKEIIIFGTLPFVSALYQFRDCQSKKRRSRTSPDNESNLIARLLYFRSVLIFNQPSILFFITLSE